jgi:AcrR family transcriptional regulator
MASRTQAPSPQKADELAQAAFALFCSRGIDGVNLDQIAAAAGVTKGSLYWHYSSKKDVILAACDLYYTRWREEMAAATGPAATVFGKLEAAIAYSVRSCLLNDANRVFSTEVIALSLYDSDLRASWAHFQDEVDRFFLGLTHQAVGNGELLCEDVDRAVDLMIAAMEGIKQIALFRPQICAPQSEQRTCRRLMSLLGTPA